MLLGLPMSPRRISPNARQKKTPATGAAEAWEFILLLVACTWQRVLSCVLHQCLSSVRLVSLRSM